MTKPDRYITALQQAGRRITEQRRIICEYLAETRSHPTPYQVYAEISRRHPEISRATVYNTLNVLQQLGAIVEIGSGAGHTRYETDTTPHVNLICLRCHAIIDYAGPLPLDDVQAALGGSGGFQPVAMRVDLFGFCAACRARKQAEIRAQWHQQQQAHTQERVNS
jgi:Fur family peroxide stress response transcriptional regulator